MIRLQALLLLIVFAAWFGGSEAGAAAPPPSAMVRGRVVYRPDPKQPWRFGRYYVKNSKTGELAEAVVCLSGTKPAEASSAEEKAPADEKALVVDQKDFRFIPETVALRAGRQVKFLNSDPHVHNVMTIDGAKPFNVNMAPGGHYLHTFTRAGGLEKPIRLSCIYHSAMRGWIFVFEHRFFQVTEADGRFQWADVPPGNYELKLLHPAGGLSYSTNLEVKAGQTIDLTISLSPDNKRSRNQSQARPPEAAAEDHHH